MKKSKYRFFKSKWLWIAIVIILAIAGYIWMKSGTAAPSFQAAPVAIGDVIQQVSVTGTVSPDQQANMAFEKGGNITHIYVKVGDTVKAGAPIASLDNASDQAALASAEATLADMSRSLTPSELAVQQSSVAAAKTALDNAKQTAVDAFHTAYVQAQGAVVNYGDNFFSNPQSANPTINIRTESATEQLSINNERVSITDVLNNWSNELTAASTSNISNAVRDANGYLVSIKSFMSDLSAIVNSLSPGNSGLPQQAIDADTSAMNSARTALNMAISTITSAQTGLTSAQSAYDQAVSNYNLKLSGNSSDSIAAQAAKVAQAQAILGQDTLTAPIDGIMTMVSPQLGNYVGAGQTQFTIQNSQFKIEAYVPEADIAKVKVGDSASSTLDAYGAYVDFPAQVTMIDPAETILQGVPTYKVTLHFVSPDSRIRSGMTDNLEILTADAQNVLKIPYRAITVTATSTTVNVVSTDGKTYSAVPVTTGLKGSDGFVELTSGLSEGDKVVTYVTGQ